MDQFLQNGIFLHITSFITIALIVMISQIIYSAIGFGSGMFAVSLLSLIFGDIDIIVPFLILIAFPTELTLSIKDKKFINFKQTSLFLIFIFPALILGTLFLKKANADILLLLLGIFIIIFSIYTLFFQNKSFTLKSKYWIPFLGTISGLLGGMFGTGGPPIIFYYKSKNITKKQFRAALISIFLFMSIFRIIVYIYFHLLSFNLLILALAVLPFGTIGIILGNMLHNRIDEELFKKITSIILLISGIMLLLK